MGHFKLKINPLFLLLNVYLLSFSSEFRMIYFESFAALTRFVFAFTRLSFKIVIFFGFFPCSFDFFKLFFKYQRLVSQF